MIERMSIDSTGIVYICPSTLIKPTIVHSGTIGNLAKLRLINRSGQSADKGGVVELGGVTDDSYTRSDVFGAIAGLKSSNTSANREGYLQFSTSSGSALTERMRIDAGGNVGIGITSPSTAYNRQLQIHAGGTGSSLHLTDNSTGSGNGDGLHILTYGGVCYLINRENDAMIFLNNGTEHFRIAAGGDLTATDTSIGSNSDSRLKTNIESYTYDISKFKSYSPKKFDWINPAQHGDRSQQIGFIAQEQEIIDERFIGSITLENNGVENNPDVSLVAADRIVKTSKFGQMDAMYISVIQQLITRLETAEATIKSPLISGLFVCVSLFIRLFFFLFHLLNVLT